MSLGSELSVRSKLDDGRLGAWMDGDRPENVDEGAREGAAEAWIGDVPTLPADPGVEGARAKAQRALFGRARDASVGRFIVLGELGRGGMGVVYAAYDPELDRKVAVKLLATAPGQTQAGRASARLLREAQALAKLNHPNVVTVHEVGEQAGTVYIAMEFVQGRTLTKWLAQSPRTPEQVLDVFARAAQGLAAAHAKGLVHRDFKPDNVMVADEGEDVGATPARVLVMDFGLARPQVDVDTQPPPVGSPEARHDALGTPLTRTGRLVGTPAYMAPEQFMGEPAQPSSDQFAFCVSLWEGLFGQRPFAGDDVAELALAVTEGRMGPVPRRPRVARWTLDVLRRGLAVDPSKRWPDMATLLDAFGRGRRRARRRIFVAGLVVVGLVGAGAYGGYALDRSARIEVCEEAGAAIGEVWNEQTQRDLREAVLRSNAGNAETILEKTTPWLDRYAEAWAEARTAACTSTEVDRIWSPEDSDRALWCLDERRMAFEVLLQDLSTGDREAVQSATVAAASLPPLGACEDLDRLARLPAPPPAHTREEVRAARRELARATTLETAGKYSEGIAVARELLDRIEELHAPALSAAVQWRLGSLLEANADYAEAEAMLEEAFFEAMGAGAADLVAETATDLGALTGATLARRADGERWLRHAETALRELGEEQSLRDSRRLKALGEMKVTFGAHDQAHELLRRALAIEEQLLIADDPRIGTTLMALADVAAARFDKEAPALYERAHTTLTLALGAEHPTTAEALVGLASSRGLIRESKGTDDSVQADLALGREAVRLTEAALGSNHPRTAHALQRLAWTVMVRDPGEEAVALAERAYTIAADALGAEHPATARALHVLAFVHANTGAPREGAALLRRSIRIREEVLGSEHPDLANAWTLLGDMQSNQERATDALHSYERALEIRRRHLPDGHPVIALTVLYVGVAHSAMADYEAAAERFEQALTMFRAKGDSLSEAITLTQMAELDLKRLRPRAAIEDAEKAVAILEPKNLKAHRHLASARFRLARALWEANEDRERALELARQAQKALRHGLVRPRDVSEVEAWLQQRDPEASRH